MCKNEVINVFYGTAEGRPTPISLHLNKLPVGFRELLSLPRLTQTLNPHLWLTVMMPRTVALQPTGSVLAQSVRQGHKIPFEMQINCFKKHSGSALYSCTVIIRIIKNLTDCPKTTQTCSFICDICQGISVKIVYRRNISPPRHL